ALWFDSAASTVAVNDFLNQTDEDFIVIKAGDTVDLSFVPDPGGVNGQGTSIPAGLESAKVTAVNGSCKLLRAEDATQATTKVDAYASGSAVTLAVNDELRRGDMAICDKGSSTTFTIRYKAFADYGPYQAIPAVIMYQADK